LIDQIALKYLKGRKSKDLNRRAISKVCGVLFMMEAIYYLPVPKFNNPTHVGRVKYR
jgi:hypothetical protein